MEWQPIESAPKDGSRVIIYDPDIPSEKGIVTEALFDSWRETWTDTVETYLRYNPTHWMPLPEPPQCK